MGLLDRAEKISKTGEVGESTAKKVNAESPSLLRKAEKFREVESHDDIPDLDWLDDESDNTPAWEIGDLPDADGEEDFDLSDIPELQDSFEDFGSLDDIAADPNDELEDPFSDELIDREEEKSEEPTESSSFLDKPDYELLADDKTPTEEVDDLSLPEIQLEDEPNKEDLVLPEKDLFEEWEEEAVKEAAKQPLRPKEEDPAPLDQDVLFDDDSDYATAPMAYHLASKKRIENYQAIFEITKEVSNSSNFSDFFDNLVYSVIGQVGCSSIVIFASTNPKNSKWNAVATQGVTTRDSWYFSNLDEVYSRITDSETVIYAGEFKTPRLPPRELAILNETSAEILIPIRNKDHCYGMMTLGKQINGEEYITDDLEFVKIIGDIAGAIFERVYEFEKLNDQLIESKQIIEINEAVLKAARDFAKVRKMDDAYDLLVENLKTKIGVRQFSLLILDNETKEDYVVFGSNFILPERAKDFKLGKQSDIVGMVSNVSGVYKLENFREDAELKSIFTNDELGVMSEFTILPIINLNWLVGMVIIHATATPWTDTTRDVAVALLETSAPVFANLLILHEKEALFRNPFNPLETKILSEIENASKFNLSFTVSLFKIQNVPRMIQIAGAGVFARYADVLRKTIVDHISENDYFTRVGQGKFVMVLHGKDKEETEVVIRKIKSAFSKKEDQISHNFKASYRVLTLSYPKDTKDKNQFLEMVEEA
ncbi:MAG: GAF domain-containing protein [Leptospira sp.]|nr:GAF domain-containing protein [Leptospira sp.]